MGIIIHSLGSYSIQNYVLETKLGYIAIDTGLETQYEKFVKRFEIFAPLSELKYIFLTHAHNDHAGFLNKLIKTTSANVVLHELAVEKLLIGENDTPTESGFTSKITSLFGVIKKDYTFPVTDVKGRGIIVSDKNTDFFEKLGLPLEIIKLPGHTSCSIGLYNNDSKVLFCGDAAMNTIINQSRYTIWIDNLVEFQNSWDIMINLNPNKIYPAHGTPFRVRDLIKHRHDMDNKKLIPFRVNN